ncbi:MAG: czcC 2 [Planctomycetaceae bacterium]|nr:czcC 2 [Planctomycetaceae bacterium]
MEQRVAIWMSWRLLVCWPFLLPVALQAQEPSGLPGSAQLLISPSDQETTATVPVMLLTLETLQNHALEHNPTLEQAAAAIEQARGNMIQTGLYPNPQVGYLRSDPNRGGQSRTQGVFLGQEIVTAGKLQKSRDVESQEVNRLTWQQSAQRQRVLNDVQIRYYEVLGAQSAVALSKRLLALAEAGVKTTEDLQQAQQATRVDVLQSRLQLKTVRLSLREAEIRHRAAWKQLVSVVGCPNWSLTPVEGKLDRSIPEFDWDSSWQRLTETSPLLGAARSRIDHAFSELRREEAQPIPNVNLQLVVERDAALNYTTASTLFSVPIPVFNRNQGNIYHAHADIREAQAEVRRTELALHDALADAFKRFESALAQVTAFRDDILPDAKESLKLTTEGYKAGEIGFLQVLGARQTYFSTELGYVDALTEMQKVAVELDGLLLTGGLNPAEVGTALQTQTGFGGRQRGILNQLQEGASKQVLPAVLQTGP